MRAPLLSLMLIMALSSPPAFAHGDSGAFSEGDSHHERAAESAGTASAAEPEQPDGGQARDHASEWPLIEAASSLVGTALVEEQHAASSMPALGWVIPHQSAVQDINAYMSGRVSEIAVRPGQWVEKGERIASIYSPEFILTQKAYLALLKNDQLRETLRQEGRLPNYMRDSRSNLRWWGMTEEHILALEASKEPVSTMNVLATASGIITEVFVEPGEVISAGDRAMEKFVVVGAPLARMVLDGGGRRVEGLIPMDRLLELVEGETYARVQVPGGEDLELPVSQVNPTLQQESRMGRFFVDLGDPAKHLELGQMVRMDLVRTGRQAAWLPREAIMGQGTTSVAYIEVDEGEYERRDVKILEQLGDWALADSVRTGERVVTRGKMLLEGAYRLGANGSAGMDSHHH